MVNEVYEYRIATNPLGKYKVQRLTKLLFRNKYKWKDVLISDCYGPGTWTCGNLATAIEHIKTLKLRDKFGNEGWTVVDG